MKNNASKPFSAAQNVRRLCHVEEINHPLAHQSRESAIGNNTSKGEYFPCISHSRFLSFAINAIGV